MKQLNSKLFSTAGNAKVSLWKTLRISGLLILMHHMAFAQAMVAGATQLQQTIIDIVNIIFVIVIVIGLIRVIAKVVKQEPDWGGAVMGLVVALILWGGFNAYKTDLFNFFGGQQLLNPLS